jgi:hypothetical protein
VGSQSAEKARVLLVPRHDDSNTATGNISEADVEATEFISDDDEHSERFVWIFNLRQKFRGKTERQCDLCGLIEVRLQNVPAGRSATIQSFALKLTC